MKNTGLVMRCVPCVCLTLLAAIGAWYAPLENNVFAATHPHPDHYCRSNTICGMVMSTSPDCPNPGDWCVDSTTLTQFPKCMPQTNSNCEEDYLWGHVYCGNGRCQISGAPCNYTLNYCIP